MKIIMVAVISKDGFITLGTESDVSKWTSVEDRAFFAKIKSEHNLFVMGSKTYDSGEVLPRPNTLTIVLTSKPEKYTNQAIVGQLEFKNLSAQEFKDKYDSKYATCLLLGGGYTYTEFLEKNLVDEIYLTVETVLNKTGVYLLNRGKNIRDFASETEVEVTILNSTNTILKHYVLKK